MLVIASALLVSMGAARALVPGDVSGLDGVALSVELDHNCSVDARVLESKLEDFLTARGVRVHRGSSARLVFAVLAHRTNDGYESVALHVSARLEESAVADRDGAPRRCVTWIEQEFDVVDIEKHVARVDEIAVGIAADLVDAIGTPRHPPTGSAPIPQAPPDAPADASVTEDLERGIDDDE